AAGEHRHCSAGVHRDKSNIRIAEHYAVHHDTCDGAGNVEIELEHGCCRTIFETSAAGRSHRVHINDRVPPIQLLPHGLEIFVTGPAAFVVVAVDADAIHFQSVETIFNLLEGSFDIWKRHTSKQSELLRMCLHQLCAVVISDSDVLASGFRTVVKNVSHLSHR